MVGVAFLMTAWWTQYGADPQNTFFAPGAGALSGEPLVRWSYEGVFEAVSPLVDVEGDGKHEVVAYEWHKGTFLLNGEDGSIRWHVPLRDSMLGAYNHPLAGDIDGDGVPEVIYMDEDTTGLVWQVLDAATGAPEWFVEDTAHRNEFTVSKLGDIDGDGVPELVLSFPTEAITAVEGDGTVLWQFPTGDPTGGAIGDVDGDGEAEVVVGANPKKYFILSGATGAPEDSILIDTLWDYNLPPTLADLDGDGVDEIIIVGKSGYSSYPGDSGYVIAFDYSGGGFSKLWCYSDTVFNYYFQAMAGDLDGDGLPDIVALSRGSAPRKVVAFKGTDGSILWEKEISSCFPYLGHLHSGALADVDGDGWLEVLVPMEFCGDSTVSDTLLCLNGEDGSELWKKAVPHDIHAISLADVDGDGELEIAVPTHESLVVLDNERLNSEEKGSRETRLSAIGLRGAIAFRSNVPASVEIFFPNGRLLKALKLQPGRTLVPLKPGVYFWKAGELSGKAVVKP